MPYMAADVKHGSMNVPWWLITANVEYRSIVFGPLGPAFDEILCRSFCQRGKRMLGRRRHDGITRFHAQTHAALKI